MRSDILIPKVENVLVAVTPDDEDFWQVYIINRLKISIINVLITSKGYGGSQLEKQKTSILRHSIPEIEPGQTALIEPLPVSLVSLTNEYWVSFYKGPQLFDKKYIFLAGTILQENLIFIEELGRKGILHP